MNPAGKVIEEFSSRVYAKLAAKRGAKPQAAVTPWTPPPAGATKRVASHLEGHYGIRVRRMSPIDSGFRVDRHDGPSWVARVFNPSRPRGVIECDAEILRFLEENAFPAERLAHADPISAIDDFTILVTGFVEGAHVQPSGPAMHRLGELHGLLHTLPCDRGAAARDAGSWHGLSVEGGTRRVDVETLLPLLADARRLVAKEQQGHYDVLRRALEGIDHCEDLPHALIHIDFGGPNVLQSPDGELVGIDWTGAGRGPRVLGLAALLASGRRDPRLVDAFVAGYRQHVKLEPDELARLAPALRVHSLVLDCWGAVFRPVRVADAVRSIPAWRELTESVAGRARDAFASPRIDGFEAVPPPPPMEDAFQVLVDAVKGKTDDEVTAFAASVGGYPRLCQLVFQGMSVRLAPEQDCSVGFVLGDGMGWVFRSTDGKVSVSRRIAKRAGAIVRSSPADFLRVITQDLDWDTGIAQGRVVVEGDPSHVERVFANRRA